MYSKEENIKSIEEYIKNHNKELSIQEIEYLEQIKLKIEQAQNDDELLKWNCILAMFINTETLEKLKKALKRDQYFRWAGLLLKLLAILISFYH